MTTEKKRYLLMPWFTAKDYLISVAVTLFIFLLGFKWTLLGLFWIPVILNPFIYVFVVIAWIYYNFIWLRTALYLPSTMIGIKRSYAAFGIKLSWLKCFYLTLCKANKIRKEDITIKRQNEYIKVLAATFSKPAIMLDFKRGEAHQLSTAIFIHTRRKVVEIHKAILPYMIPTFIALLILTPLFVFAPSYNYAFLAQKLSHTPPMMSFWMYLILLPVKFLWIFTILSILSANIIAPLVVMPAINIFAAYAKEKDLKLKLKKEHSISFDAAMSVLMIVISLLFYISILSNILL